jgi:quercetin dioxygenase-like cupin family protein
MKRSIFTLAVTLALGIAVGAGLTSFVNAMQHVKVKELYKADLVTSEGKEASMFLAELGPGANMGKHYHPGDAFAYILEGTMLLEIVGKESVTLKPGQSGSLPPRTVHDDKNASQTAPLKFLVFHVAKKGDPLAVPVQWANVGDVWRPAYMTRMEHSPTSATGTGWERTPWQATEQAARNTIWRTSIKWNSAPVGITLVMSTVLGLADGC